MNEPNHQRQDDDPSSTTTSVKYAGRYRQIGGAPSELSGSITTKLRFRPVLQRMQSVRCRIITKTHWHQVTLVYEDFLKMGYHSAAHNTIAEE